MLGGLLGLLTTFKEFLRKPVTVQYPDEHMPLAPRYIGFPALTWDEEVGEPFCTGCGLCMRNCPTQCISVTMKENPLYQEGKSTRRRTVDTYQLNWARCILCGICTQVCNFDSIIMSHEHERAAYSRDGNKMDLAQLLEAGRRYQKETGWQPTRPRRPAGRGAAEESRSE